jgi:photosystem II stability/assembly factor-like uncharacterized protein
MYASLAKGYGRRWRLRATGAEALIIRSRDGGASWETLSNGIPTPNPAFANTILVDETQPGRVFAGMTDGQILASDDRGDSWRGLGVTLPEVNDVRCVQS